MPKVLTVGAYDRDNFGDLLLLLVTEHYLGEHEVVAGGLVNADMTALLDRKVEPYGRLLDAAKFAGIWTVGGEIGGTDLQSAYWMATPADEYSPHSPGTPAERRTLLDESIGYCPTESAYIPAPLAYRANAGVPTVINSAGIAQVLCPQVSPRLREETIALLRGTTLISVRDQASSDFLRLLGVDHKLAPDAVHTIASLHPKGPEGDADVALVQVSRANLAKLGLRNLASALAESRQLKGLRIRVLLAGTAPGHDSFDEGRALAAAVKAISPGLDMNVLNDRRPDDLVEQISTARIVISTSLHVRIVAAAYKVPRVTFAATQNRKVNGYAERWDSTMPFDIGLAGLDQAIARALRVGGDPVVRANSDHLAKLADENLKSTVRRFDELVATSTPESESARLRTRRAHDLFGYRF